MARKIYRSSLSKRQREQYDNLKSRGIDITPRQVREYFSNARTINREFNKLIENRFVEEVNISENLSFAENQEDLNRWLGKINRYAKETNRVIDEIETQNIAKFKENLTDIFPQLESVLGEISPSQLKEFIEKPENYRYRDLIYESLRPDAIDDIINLTDKMYENVEGLENAFREVMKPRKKGKK